MHTAKLHLRHIGLLWPMGTFAFAVLKCAGNGGSLLGSEIDWSQTTQIVYQYDDSSVPPQYHRSYRIDVSPVEARVTIDSYGTVLADKSHMVIRAEFDGLLESLSRNAIRNVLPRDNDRCNNH